MQENLFDKKKKPSVTKHQLLGKYLRAWAIIIRKKFPRSDAWYVDAFAGEGKYRSGEKGSPLIAADLLREEQKTTCRFHVICIEKDKARARKLRQCEADLEGSIPFAVRQGEFVSELPWVLERIGSDPAFFFLDPLGFAGMPLAAIDQILTLPHKEVLVNFMWNAIQWWSKAPSSQRALTELMGTDAWRGLGGEDEWIDLYVRQLRATGSYVWGFRNKFPGTGAKRTLYYLVYATKVLIAFKIMKDVMFKQDTRRYFEPDLFEQMEFSEFVKEVHRRVRTAGALPRRDLLEFTLCETQHLDRHLRKALKQLQEAGRIIKEGPPQSPVYRGSGQSGSGNDAGLVQERAPASYGSSSSALAAPPFPRIKISYGNYECLDGTERTLVRRVGDGSIVKRFDRTPIPKKERDVVCPHFLELKWAYGCPYDCAWCYLKGTFRFSPKGPQPTVKRLDKVRRHTIAFLESDSQPELLNTGEIADSLMYESGRNSFVSFILPLFEAQNKHKVLLLSKSNRIDSLLSAPSHRQVVASFSLNARDVASKWETRAPAVSDRIKAAKALFDEGYEVRIRIDPLVPVPGWRQAYLRLLDEVFEDFRPARITLGSLRGLQSTINNCPDKTWVAYLSDTSGWGRRVDFGLRCDMFATLIEALRQQYDYATVALCKETLGLWATQGMDFRRIQCNCIL
ncbi:three-Cys-motif partner protein TcmP [bacterium]|nr:three-Cys-motif partner protein TcmP [bacterium]